MQDTLHSLPMYASVARIVLRELSSSWTLCLAWFSMTDTTVVQQVARALFSSVWSFSATVNKSNFDSIGELMPFACSIPKLANVAYTYVAFDKCKLPSLLCVNLTPNIYDTGPMVLPTNSLTLLFSYKTNKASTYADIIIRPYGQPNTWVRIHANKPLFIQTFVQSRVSAPARFTEAVQWMP